MMPYRACMLRHFNVRVLCFLWRLTYSGEFLAVIESMKRVICNDKYNSTICTNLDQQENAAYEHSVYDSFTDWQTITMLTWLVPSFFMIPLIALYLHRGRKKNGLVAMAFLQMLSSIMYLMNAIFAKQMYVTGYLAAAVLHASYGFTYGFRLLSYAYLADVVASYTPERRSAEMILQSSFRALGAIVSPYLMGYLLTHYGAKYAFILSSSFDALMLVYTLILPEPKPCNRPAEDETAPLRGSDTQARGIRGFFAPLAHAKGPILRIVIVYSILETLTISTFNFLPIYVTHSPYSFKPEELGVFQTTQYLFAFVGSMLISQVFTRIVGKQDIGIVLACILARIFMYGVFMVADSKMLLYVALLSEIINYIYVGALYSYATEITGKKAFVPLFTLMSQVGLVVCAVTYPLVNYIFKVTARSNPKLVFVFLLFLTAIALVTWIVHIRLSALTIEIEGRPASRLTNVDPQDYGATYGSTGTREENDSQTRDDDPTAGNAI